MKRNLLATFVLSLIAFKATADVLKDVSAKVVIRKMSALDGKVTEVCSKTISAPVFQILEKMPMAQLPFAPVKCTTMMEFIPLTIIVTPNILEANVSADSKDLMLADLGGGAVTYVGGTLTVEAADLPAMTPDQIQTLKLMQPPIMNGSSLVGAMPSKVFITMMPIANNSKPVDQFTATLLIESKK